MPKQIHILHIFGSLDRGGAESRTMDIYRSIDKEKVQFDFAVHSAKMGFFEKEIKDMGGNVFHEIFPYSPFYFIRFYQSCLAMFKKHTGYVAVHIHTANSAVPIALAAHKCGIKTIIVHARQADETSVLRRIFTKLHRPLLCKLSTCHFAVSQSAGEFIFGKNTDFQVIPNAIPLDRYVFDPTVRAIKQRELSLEGSLTIILVGRFTMAKNHVLAIEAFQKLHQMIGNTKLLLVGDGELRDEIGEQIEAMGLKENVLMLGVRNDIHSLLMAADLFIMPSFFEGLPGAAIEAQASGLPCLISNTVTHECSVLEERVKYIPISSSDLWADAMYQALLSEPLDRNTFAAMKLAGFDIEDVVNVYQNFYLRL